MCLPIHPQGWTLTQVASTSLYLALPTAKTAFAMTLIRISSGKIKAILYITLAAMWAYSIVLTIVTWLNICGQSMVEFSEGHCVPANTLYWIHISKCIFAIFEDALFTALPWTIVAKVSVPAKERWAVGSSMSLVGFAGVIAIVRYVRQTRGLMLYQMFCIHQSNMVWCPEQQLQATARFSVRRGRTGLVRLPPQSSPTFAD